MWQTWGTPFVQSDTQALAMCRHVAKMENEILAAAERAKELQKRAEREAKSRQKDEDIKAAHMRKDEIEKVPSHLLATRPL